MTGTICTDGPPEHADGAYRRGLWDVAFGLQGVDGLEPSAYARSLADDNVGGRMTLNEVGERLDDHYRQERSRLGKSTRVEEADKVSYHIVEMLEDASFSLDARMLNVIHGHLFQGIDDNKYAPGVFKSESLIKCERILNGDSVLYGSPLLYERTLELLFSRELSHEYGSYSDAPA